MIVSSHDIVAIILALCVLVFVFSGTTLRILMPNELAVPQETAQAWRDIINVIIGALAGYIAGKSNSN
jgi:hypothetical protein